MSIFLLEKLFTENDIWLKKKLLWRRKNIQKSITVLRILFQMDDMFIWGSKKS